MQKIILAGCLIINEKNELLLLHRKDHNHYETPGGKIKPEECRNIENPTIEELKKAAERELNEEIGNTEFTRLEYFGKIEFTIPDGRKAIANKFITKIKSGTPKIKEPKLFDKIGYIPINKLNEYKISPDLKLLTKNIKNRLYKEVEA